MGYPSRVRNERYNSLNMKCDSQKRNVFKWTENHFGAIPLVRDGSETAFIPFDCALEQVYFVIVLQLHQIQKLFAELSELLCYFLWAFYMNHLPRYRIREWRLKSWVAVPHFHISSCGIAFNSITSFPLSPLQGENIRNILTSRWNVLLNICGLNVEAAGARIPMLPFIFFGCYPQQTGCICLVTETAALLSEQLLWQCISVLYDYRSQFSKLELLKII
jgi:hypothetical protein